MTSLPREHVYVCRTDELAPGDRMIREIAGLSVGVFNVGGRFYALRNRCPHKGGALCRGPLTGTALASEDLGFEYARDGELLRCAWHGWEFEISTGRSLVDPKVRAKTYPVEVRDGKVYLLLTITRGD